MFEFMLECHLLMLFLILLRALFGSFLSAKMRYALWLFIPLRFLPFGLLFGADYFGKSDWENTSYAATGFLCPV